MPPKTRKPSITKTQKTSATGTRKTSGTKPRKTPTTKRSEKQKTVDIDKPTAGLPLYLERLLDQLDKAAEQGIGSSEEVGEWPISFDLLLAASRVGNSELRLRRENLDEQRWSILKEGIEKAENDDWYQKREDNPYANIRGYVRNARLPPLPWCLEASKAEIAETKQTAGGKIKCDL